MPSALIFVLTFMACPRSRVGDVDMERWHRRSSPVPAHEMCQEGAGQCPQEGQAWLHRRKRLIFQSLHRLSPPPPSADSVGHGGSVDHRPRRWRSYHSDIGAYDAEIGAAVIALRIAADAFHRLRTIARQSFDQCRPRVDRHVPAVRGA
jgi:hypothetical protein